MCDTRRRGIGKFIRLLDMSVANANLYSPRHRQVLHLTESALNALFPLLAKGPLSLLIIEGEVVADGARRLIEALAGPVRQGGGIHSSEHLRLGRVEVRHAAAADGGTKRLDLAELPAAERARFQPLCEGVRKHGKLQVTRISEVV